MTGTLPKGIFKRGDVYAMRFSVPTEVQAVVGKKEIIRSLGTKDLGEALGKRGEVSEQIRASLFSDFEAPTGSAEPLTPKSSPARVSTVRATAHRWLSESDGINNATRARYRSILERFEECSGNCQVTKINRELALGFMDHLKSMRSPKTGQLLSHRSLSIHQICLSSYWRVVSRRWWTLSGGGLRAG